MGYLLSMTSFFVIEFSRPVFVSGFPSLVRFSYSNREATYVLQPTESSLYFEYKVCLGDESLKLDYWTDELLKISSSLKLQGGSIMLKSSRPIVNADIHLNPGAGFLLGKVDQTLQNGIVDFGDLAVGSRGLEYKIRFSLRVKNVTIETFASIEIDPSCELELIANVMDRDDNDMFGYSTSISNNVIAVGAPHARNPLPEIQVISLCVETLAGEHEIRVIETKIMSNYATLQIQSFGTSAFSGEAINGKMSISYYGTKNYSIGAPLIIPVDIDSAYLAAKLESNYPFLGPISVSRSENRLCMCQNAWTWTITYHDASYETGVFRAHAVSLTGSGSFISDTAIILSPNLIGGSFFIHISSKNMKSSSVSFDATSSELSLILENDLGLDVLSVNAINTNYQDKPALGRKWTITFSACGDERCLAEFDVDGSLLSGTEVSIASFTVYKGRTPLGGSFALSMLGSKTSYYIPFNATANQVRTVLESLESLQLVSVSDQPSSIGEQKLCYTWTVTFLSVNRHTGYGWIPDQSFHDNLPLIDVISDKLMGYRSFVTVDYVSDKKAMV